MKRGVRDQYTPKVFDFRSWKDVIARTEMQEVWEVQGLSGGTGGIMSLVLDTSSQTYKW